MWSLNRRSWRWIVPAVLLPLLCVVLLLRPGDAVREAPKSDVSHDLALAKAVLHEPERFTQSMDVTAAGTTHRSPESSRPPLLSRAGRYMLPVSRTEPAALDDFRFHREFASLRSAALRDPNSPDNRSGVKALMMARQRRLAETESVGVSQ